MAAVPRAAYVAARARYEQRQQRWGSQLRWQRQRAGILAKLETRWRA